MNKKPTENTSVGFLLFINTFLKQNLILKYSFLMTPFHQLSFTINDKVIEFTII